MATTKTTTLTASELISFTHFPQENELEVVFSTGRAGTITKRMSAQQIFDWLYTNKRIEHTREPLWDLSKPKPRAKFNDVCYSTQEEELHFGFYVGRNFGILIGSVPDGELRKLVLETQRS